MFSFFSFCFDFALWEIDVGSKSEHGHFNLLKSKKVNNKDAIFVYKMIFPFLALNRYLPNGIKRPPSRHLLVQSYPWKHQNNMRNLLKVNRFYKFFRCFHCWRWTSLGVKNYSVFTKNCQNNVHKLDVLSINTPFPKGLSWIMYWIMFPPSNFVKYFAEVTNSSFTREIIYQSPCKNVI